MVQSNVEVVGAYPAALQVAAGAEGLFARAGEDDDGDGRVVGAHLERLLHPGHHAGGHGVHGLGPVQRDGHLANRDEEARYEDDKIIIINYTLR